MDGVKTAIILQLLIVTTERTKYSIVIIITPINTNSLLVFVPYDVDTLRLSVTVMLSICFLISTTIADNTTHAILSCKRYHSETTQ